MSDTTPSDTRERSYSGGYMAAGELAQKLFLGFPGIRNVRDMTTSSEYQLERGIDFLFDGKCQDDSAEVKSDKYLTGSNWLFETQRINLTAPAEKMFVSGWSVKSQANWLFVLSPEDMTFHYLRFKHYREGFMEALAVGTARAQLIPTDRIKKTLVCLFPKSYVTKQESYHAVPVTWAS